MNMRYILVFVLFSALISLQAQTSSPKNTMADRYWSGNSGSSDNIDQGSNWWGSVNPSSGDNLYFNNTGTRHTANSNYGSGSWFGNIITYNGAGGIKWTGNTTWAYKFENNNDGSLFEIGSDIGNRSSPDQDLEINPVGSGGVKITGAIAITGSKWIKVYGNNQLEVSGVISGSSTPLYIYDQPTVILTGANTFTGDLYIYGGSVDLRNTTDPLDVANIYLGNGSGSQSATLKIGASSVTVDNAITVVSGSSGTSTISYTPASGTGTINSNVTLNKALDVNVANGGTLIMSGAIGGTQNLVVKGQGTLRLNGDNTFKSGSDGLYIVNGTCELNNTTDGLDCNVKLGETSGSDAATLQIGTAAVTVDVPVEVRSGSSGTKYIKYTPTSGTGTISGAITLSTPATFDVASGGTLACSGGMSGANNITKTGSGVLSLSGTQSYSGTTSVSAGTLKSSVSLSSSTITVSNAATFEATENISVNSLTLNSGSTLTVASGKTLTVTGTFTNSGATISSSGTVLFGGSSAQSFNGTFNNNVTISNASGTSLAGSTTVEGTLSLTNGDIDLNGNTLTLGSSASLSETAGNTVKGTTGKITTTRTINAPSALDVAGMGATLTSAANLGSTTIERYHSAPSGNGNTGISRYYYINPTTNTGLNATLVFKYDESELNSKPEDKLVLFKSATGAVDSWTQQPGGTLNTTANTITLTSISGFSYWGAGDSTAPFPVELNVFGAKISGRDVHLNWNTATEMNSSKFVVERSTDSNIWERIGAVDASGYSNAPKSYSFTDRMLTTGKYNYRLKIVDNDGTHEYSPVVEAEVSVPAEFNVSQNYPNPFNPATKISYDLPEDSRVVLELYSLSGEKIARLMNDVVKGGYYSYQLDMSKYNLTSGMYLYKFSGTGLSSGKLFNSVKKMMYLR